METKVFNFEDDEPAKILKQGGVLAFPTETVFGLGVRFDNEMAFNKLVEVKRRSPDKPFTLMAGDYYDISSIAEVNEPIKRVLDKYMPGPLTVILKLKSNVPSWVTLGTSYIGFRISGDKDVRRLIDQVGVPLLVPSCNKSSLTPCSNEKEVLEQFDGEIDGVIRGTRVNGVPSTIVKITDKEITLIRQGELAFEDIKKTWEGK